MTNKIRILLRALLRALLIKIMMLRALLTRIIIKIIISKALLTRIMMLGTAHRTGIACRCGVNGILTMKFLSTNA